MSDIKHILVPTDGSEGSLHAAAFAGDLARNIGAKVTLLYVQSDDTVLSHAWGSVDGLKSVDQVRQSMEQHAREHELPSSLEALGELEQEPTAAVLWGHCSEEICRFARDNKVDLVVIGSHGRSGLKRAFLGSVSQAVANQAPCPVTVVR